MEKSSSCPRCGSINVEKVSVRAFLITLFSGIGCLFWIGLVLPIFWIIIPLAFLFLFVMLLAKQTLQCLNCKYIWLFKKKSI